MARTLRSALRTVPMFLVACGQVALLTLLATSTAAVAQETEPSVEQPRQTSPNNPALSRRPGTNDRPGRPPGPGGPARYPADLRTITGYGNNLDNPDWGAAGMPFLRLTPVAYADGVGAPADGRPNPREVSNAVLAEIEPILNEVGASDFIWQWGQFLDHDLDLTPEADPAEPFDIEVPLGDAWFDPFGTGEVSIPLDRSFHVDDDGVRQQVNLITAFIDASNVYGSDEERAEALRTLDGTGLLATSEGRLLPFNETGLPNAPSAAADFFLAGDFRANEQVGLTAMHTLFVREHNHWVRVLAEESPELTGEELYQRARAIVGAEMQAITYREFLPLLLGPRALAPYRGYDPEVNPGIANVFATAAYRLGHSMLSPQLQRTKADGSELAVGDLSLADAFFSPDEVIDHGIAPLLRGLASQQAREVDRFLVDEVRNLLFGPPGSGGLDLASLNIQRGRDHGLPSYNTVRQAYGLEPIADLASFPADLETRTALASVYDSIDELDVWVGGLAESHLPRAMVGETWFAILKDQFERLRDGDRFWYRSYLPAPWVDRVERQTLARIIQRNTQVGDELSRNVFRIADREPNP